MRVALYAGSVSDVETMHYILLALRALGHWATFVAEPPSRCKAVGVGSYADQGWRVRRDQTERFGSMLTERGWQQLVLHLGRINVPWTDTCDPKVDAVLFTSWAEHFADAFPKARRIRVLYGVSACQRSYGHGYVNAAADAVLCIGERDARLIRRRVARPIPLPVVGFPKLSPLLRGEWTRLAASRALFPRETFLGPESKLVVYAPTWGELSSVDVVAPVIEKLVRAGVRVVVKPHYMAVDGFEDERVAPLRDAGALVSPYPNLSPFLALASVVLADAPSGALTEAMVYGKKVVAIAAPKKQLLPQLERYAWPAKRDPEDVHLRVMQQLVASGLDPNMRPQLDAMRPFMDLSPRDDVRAAEAIEQIVFASGIPR